MHPPQSPRPAHHPRAHVRVTHLTTRSSNPPHNARALDETTGWMWRLLALAVLSGDTGVSASRGFPSHPPGVIDKLLVGLHHVTLTRKLSELGLPRSSGSTTGDLENLISRSRTIDTQRESLRAPAAPSGAWELVKDDENMPPYYRNTVSGVVRWAPGKWRRRRTNRKTNLIGNSDIQDIPEVDMPEVTFDYPAPLSAGETDHPLLMLLSELHTREHVEWTGKPTNAPSLSAMFSLVIATAAAVALLVLGALKTHSRDQQSAGSGLPDALFCPISLDLMVDPVTVVETGQTYDRAAIKSWLYTHSTDPITNVELRSKKLVPNIAIRQMLQAIDEQTSTGSSESLVCPISLELMVDPVILAETGQTYDRATIESWLHMHSTDPITNVELRSKKLVPNIAIRKMVLSRQAKYPEQHSLSTPVAAAPRRPTSRSAWLAAIGGGMRKEMSRSESTGLGLDRLGASSSSTNNMPKVRSYTDLSLVGLETSVGGGGPRTSRAAPVF